MINHKPKRSSNTYLEEHRIKYEQQYRDFMYDDIKKMYGKSLKADGIENLEECIKNMYVLIIRSDFYFPYGDKIDAFITLYHKDETSAIISGEVLKLRKPYTNKAYRSISMKNGNTVSKLGVPIFFETRDRIENIIGIKIEWIVGNHIFSYIFNINFKNPKNKNERVYSIYTHDCPNWKKLHEYKEDKAEMFTKYDFSSVVLIDKAMHQITEVGKSEGKFISNFIPNNKRPKENLKTYTIMDMANYDIPKLAECVPDLPQETGLAYSLDDYSLTLLINYANVIIEPKSTVECYLNDESSI